jgi:hypothetical protein
LSDLHRDRERGEKGGRPRSKWFINETLAKVGLAIIRKSSPVNSKTLVITTTLDHPCDATIGVQLSFGRFEEKSNTWDRHRGRTCIRSKSALQLGRTRISGRETNMPYRYVF